LKTNIGGTQALTNYLGQHPLIATVPREEHFFDSKFFVRDENGIPVRRNQKQYGLRFQKRYPEFLNETNNDDDQQKVKIALDNTPYYLFGSEQVPGAVMCVARWVKLLAILRNPVDRVDSHYRYFSSKKVSPYNITDWVNHDIQLLQTSGVLQDWNIVDFDSFAGSEVEMLAWKHYVRNPQNSHYLVGRGLYAIQLQHWYQAMQHAGKPASDLIIIQSEKLLNSTKSVFNDIIQFLELPPFALTNAAPRHVTNRKSTLPPMPESIRETLEKLYEPYNRRLYKMLGWENVWDSPRSSSSHHQTSN
jgi:hypothetical protein